MRKIIVFALIAFVCFQFSSAQIYQGKDAEKYISGSQMVRFSRDNENPTYVSLNSSSQPSFFELNAWLSKSFNTGNDFGYNQLSKESDEFGYNHYRYQQTYKNIPIREAVFLIHVKNGKIESFNGTIFSNPSVANSKVLQEDEARNKAIASVNAETYMWQIPSNEKWIQEYKGKADATYYPSAISQIIYNAKEHSFRYAYKFDVYAFKPLSRQDVYVDAHTGKVLLTLNTLFTGNAHGTAITKYSGTQPITTDSLSTTSYRLRETGRGLGIQTYNCQTSTNYTNTDFTDTDNLWNNNNAAMDNAAGDAHWGAEMTYDYYWIKHARNSIDNNGFALLSYVHYDVAYDNAFWDGTRMTYGDGSNNDPFTALDICGHEITHGLDSYTANLDYAAESGALNEGFSDIFGTAIEFYGKPTLANWTCGENLGFVIRDIANPNASQNPDTYLGTNWDLAQEVHQNSTVISHWFYLVSQGGSGTNDIGNAYNVTGIGITKASNVAFRMLTMYLTSTSDYNDARFYAIVAATDLYGGCTPEVQCITNAMYAVGLGSVYVPAVSIDFSASNTHSCSAPNLVQFTNLSTNATSYTWTFGDGGTSTLANPSHSYTTTGNFNVKLKGVSTGCGSDSLTKAAFVSISSSNSNTASLPVTGSGQSLTCCTGTLYDSGGTGDYSDNTDGKVTIAPAGASGVTLTFSSFNFESGYDYLYVYDGPTTASTLIGQYDGTTLPNGGVIQSSGGSITLRQTSDQGVTASGFQLTWQCSLPTAPPQTNFYASELSTCSGVVHFHDITVNGPSTWLWKFGDGGTSTLQNPIHAYQTNGVFTVRLKTTNGFGTDSTVKTSYVTVANLPTLPTVTPDSGCNPHSLTLSANVGSGQLDWYNAVTDGTLLHTGSTYTTPILTTTTTYYVENKMTTTSQYVGKLDNTGGGGNYNNASNVHYEIFNCYSPVTLVSVGVYAQGAADRTIVLRDSSLTVLQSLTVTIPDGASRVTLNFPILVGYSYQLACTGTPNLYRNNNNSGVYPYLLPGFIKITESSASKPPYNANGNYYYFYNWEVKQPECSSPRVPVVATINDCSGIADINQNPTLNIYPNPAHDLLFVEFNSKTAETYSIAIHDVIGKTLLTNNLDAVNGFNKYKISLSDFVPGVYFISLKANNQNIVRKILID